MYRRQVRRRRATLVTLVITSLVLLSTHFTEGEGGPLHVIQRGITAVLSPISEGADRVFKPARDMMNWFDETFAARGENEELQDEVVDLREQLSSAKEQANSGQQQEGLLKIDDSIAAVGLVPVDARVIIRSPTAWYGTVGIDKGSSAGIAVNDPVIAAEGLVGTISAVTPTSAQVRLMSDHRSGVSAKVAGDGPSGLIVAEVGNPGSLLLDFIESEREVKPQSILVTAGWATNGISSNYPPGILIGRITQTEVAEQDTYQRIHVEPFVDLREVSAVQVLSGDDAEEQAAKAAAAEQAKKDAQQQAHQQAQQQAEQAAAPQRPPAQGAAAASPTAGASGGGPNDGASGVGASGGGPNGGAQR